MSIELTDVQEKILWQAMAEGSAARVPMVSIYRAGRYFLGADDYDAVAILGDVVGRIARDGIALAGELGDEGFIPWPVSGKEQESRLREYIAENPSPPVDTYEIWFLLTAKGQIELEEFWSAKGLLPGQVIPDIGDEEAATGAYEIPDWVDRRLIVDVDDAKPGTSVIDHNPHTFRGLVGLYDLTDGLSFSKNAKDISARTEYGEGWLAGYLTGNEPPLDPDGVLPKSRWQRERDYFHDSGRELSPEGRGAIVFSVKSHVPDTDPSPFALVEETLARLRSTSPRWSECVGHPSARTAHIWIRFRWATAARWRRCSGGSILRTHWNRVSVPGRESAWSPLSRISGRWS
ncbi:MAG: hypothetical protein QM809_01465 [Gordonia sp. (in: high G+C Gram-positive bacteria)]|uniref:hypothetical protein n=1 Tax=Gordonia sp. (in: high G+C Gram-positive bacteria) TaxID=84139 RepID=UPI0039E57CE0